MVWYLAHRDNRGHWVLSSRFAVPSDDNAEPMLVDRQSAARSIIAGLTNRRLAKNCRPYLRPRPYRTDVYTLHMVPENLFGAIWLQFARLLTAESTHRPCKFCSKLIELSTGEQGSRADREFCSNSCKLKEQRRKVRLAKSMSAAGMSVAAIAAEFETKQKHIRNWLQRKKQPSTSQRD